MPRRRINKSPEILANMTMPIALKGNHGGKPMWPSLDVASHIADLANFFFIGSLVVGVVSTSLIVWMANVKESHWDQLRHESHERIAELQAETDKSKADIAEANARQKEAELALQRVRRVLNPRIISAPEFLELLARQPKGDVEILYLRDDAETSSTAFQIGYLLQQAKWTSGIPISLPPAPLFATVSAIQGVGGNPSGITLVTREPASEEDGIAVAALLGDPTKPATTWATLMFALTRALPGHLIVGRVNPSAAVGKIRIVVAPRL